MVRLTVAALACLALTACSDGGGGTPFTSTLKRTPETSARAGMGQMPSDMARLQKAGCYTVDLFDEPTIHPVPDGVPEAHARYLGYWGGGVWGGEWCHDMVVTRVNGDGTVELLDMHAPWYDEGARASVYKRRARIDGDGVLRFSYGGVRRQYRFVGDKLLAERSGDKHGQMQAVLVRSSGN